MMSSDQVTAAGGYIAGQGEVRQGGKSDVVGAADAGLQHPAAPHRNLTVATQIMDSQGRRETTQTAELNIDNTAGAQSDGGAGLLFTVYAFVEANGRPNSLLQLHMTPDVVPAERLLDHH